MRFPATIGGHMKATYPPPPMFGKMPNTDYIHPASFPRSIMVDVKGDNRVLSLVARSGIRNILINLLDQLQRCQKSLNEFLEVS